MDIFLIFLYIGAISFGGGWAVVGLIKDILVSQNYLTFNEFKEILTAAQLTPGPIAVNMATYVGYKYYGLLGAILNTFFLLIPPIMLGVTYHFLKKSIKLEKVALINSLALGTAVLVFITLYSLGFQLIINFDLKAIIIVFIIFALLVKTKIDPIFFIVVSGLIGILIS
ncbi:MAG: Chromate transporter [Candidatus Methanofastidiosum methylothiophilum]|uniref:Chromate transporter n=1 Tax=Candidatus Methanofastidiosum methylothiophilum TaxID=1705564 RepID=A0A150JDQ5_9EURY|nr:MAG: Chromate transporter [Candidatus Methanofastidiosum methylthiophilus]KYC57135.1 MAG: Chromate transporter [Candidatus Methanofastidiosum methylthiophilus]KYC57891.1 MAG: Chromate transporter [Candidatus Methanofastidiosum methylthiophilus]OQC52552.1 MAG: Chromate transporter [Euryarchaeota archaeon ADurb.Bin023]